ncbi:MAG: sigma-70 family RNA polymerase sigma factor [Phycisphaerales bacterium]|nr:sigma-70 family RNA polymerase sigma factor [Phycisphaerales bacterium]
MSEREITQLLEAVRGGDQQAAESLLPMVYDQLRSLAASRMRGQPQGHTLQATALVHEAYMRVVGEADPGWENRGHFFFAAARAMRDILVEQARRKSARKRGGDRKRVSDEGLAVAIDAPIEDMLALNEALRSLEWEYPRKYRLVMLRFFAGLTCAQAAEMLGITERTAERDWRFARAHLHAALRGDHDA